MLENTFKLVKGIGPESEKRLWEQGITTWDDFLSKDHVKGISKTLLQKLRVEVETARLELDSGNPGYFAHRLKPADLWRVYGPFKKEALFLDIETTGLSPYWSELTVVGLYDGFDYCCLVQGQGLSEARLQKEISGYKILVTYNGSGFDLPFLKAKFPTLIFPPIHLDLMTLGRRVGLKGGLKMVEKALGMERQEDIRNMTGYEAVLLWSRYQKGSQEALRILREYNEADVVNLKTVAREIYRRLKEVSGINTY